MTYELQKQYFSNIISPSIKFYQKQKSIKIANKNFR